MIAKIDLYRVFHMVCQCESFSKAAKLLYMTQPAISQAMAHLESELDTHLFYRTPKGITLTKEGQILRDYVNSAIGILEVGEEKLLEFQNLTTGELRIGVGDTISRFYLLPYLEAFSKNYPGIKLRILNGTTTEIKNYIKAGEADVGICNLPMQEEHLTVVPCREVQDIFVCGDKYINLTRGKVDASFVVKMPLIFLEKKAISRQYVEQYLLDQGMQISPEFELGSHDLLLEFAKINLGIACVVKEFSKDYLEQGILHEIQLTKPIPKRSIGICTLRDVPISRAAKRFIQLLQ